MKTRLLLSIRTLLSIAGFIAVILAILVLVGVLVNKNANPRVLPVVSASVSMEQAGAGPKGTIEAPARQRNFGAWHYSAVRDAVTGRIDASIEFDRGSLGALRAFAALNQAQARQLASTGGQADVLITFRTLLKPDPYLAWVQANGITVQTTALRSVAGKHRVAGGIYAEQGNPFPGKTREEANGYQGISSVRGTVAVGRLPAIAADPLVFLVDVTPTLARRDLAGAGIAPPEQVDVSTGSPLWEMEDFNMMDYWQDGQPVLSSPPPTPQQEPTVPAPVPSTQPQLATPTK